MGKELQVAREESERQPVLLAIAGNGESFTTSCEGNKRTETPDHSRGNEGGKAKDTKAKSKGSGKAKGVANSSTKVKGRRRDNKDRKQDRGDEGEDKRNRRSAQELGIVYPGSYCDEDDAVPHYWKGKDTLHGGSIFQCSRCLRHIWLPTGLVASWELGNLMKRFGSTNGYCRFISRRRQVKMMMAKLQYLRGLEAKMNDKRKFARLADKVMRDDNYDRK